VIFDRLMQETDPALSRRSFLTVGAALGGGLVVGVGVPAAPAEAAAAGPAFAPNAFVCIAPDGQVTVTVSYVEMGQGTYTSIPMLVAEELEVDLKTVRVEHAPPNDKLYANPLLGLQATGNSNAIRGAFEPLRRAGATPRACCWSKRPHNAGGWLRGPAAPNAARWCTFPAGDA